MADGRERPSVLEGEGVPDLQDGTPEQQWADDPQEMPAPAEKPLGSDEYGTTVEEQVHREPLHVRLAREQAESDVDASERETGRLVEPDEGAHPDLEKDAVAREAQHDVSGRTAEEEAVYVSDEDRVSVAEDRPDEES
jgi:hypothetical protein